MKIHEYQGKEIFRRFEMATPRGIPAFSVDEAEPGTRFVLMSGRPYGETPVFNGPLVD